MLPVILGFQFLSEYLTPLVNTGAGSAKGLLYYALVSPVVLIVMTGLAYLQYNSTYTKIYEESARRRISLAETLRKLPLAFFGKKDIADLSSTIMEDATQVEMLFSHAVPQIYAAVVNILLMGVLMFFYNWKMSLAAFWVVPVAALVFLLSSRYQMKVHENLYSVKRDISDEMQEGLEAIHEIKSCNREEDYSDNLELKLKGYEKILVKGELLIGSLINLSYIFLKLGLPSVIIAGVYLLSSGSINVFTYLVFIILAGRIYNPVMETMDHFALLIYLNVRIARMKEMDHMPRQEGASDFRPENYDIEFHDVGFSYEEGVQALKNVNFTAKQGDVTALIGPSGGGKSTVAKLSARFWDINRGEITLGGQNIALVDPETLLNNFSIVFQDVTLFNASVRENIRLGKRGATDDEVFQAARLAQCDEFVSGLPFGYDTIIGENGEKLSGGERQRISIARAILKDAPIILLDEATASLDAENESRIQKALGELIREKTVLIIAHRMRTVLGADKIVVIKDGSITETGSPAELVEKEGFFSSMLNMQYQGKVG